MDDVVPPMEEVVEETNGAHAPVSQPQIPFASPAPEPASRVATHTVKYQEHVPARNPMGALMNGINSRPPLADTRRSKNDRDFLDEIMVKPDACDYKIKIHRILPTVNDSGEQLPVGLVHDCPFMTYDDLVDEIGNAWGGGKYRCTICDQNGRFIESINRAIMIEISTATLPPKLEKYARPAPKTAQPAQKEDGDGDEYKRRQQEIRQREQIADMEDREQKRQEDRERRRDEADTRALERKVALAKLQASLNPPPQQADNSKFEAEVKRIEDARKEDTRRLEEARKEDQRKHEEMVKRLEEVMKEQRAGYQATIDKLVDRLEALKNAPPQEDKMMPVLLAMLSKPDSSKEMILAMMSRPAAPDTSKEMIVEMNRNNTQLLTAALTNKPDQMAPIVEAIKSSTDMATKMMSRENTAQQTMVANLMQAFVNKKDQSELIFNVMKFADERADRMLGMQGGGSGGDKDGGDDDWNPNIGFLGNAGKQLFKGFEKMLKAAVDQPELLEVIKSIFHKPNPSQMEVANAAWNFEQQMGMQQRPQFAPTNAQYAPFPQMPAPQQPLLAQPQQPVQQPRQQMRPMPNRPQQAPAQAPQSPQQTAAAPQLEPEQPVLDELTAAASGLPTNADPDAATEPVASDEQLKEQHLRDHVTETMKSVIEEALAKPNEREWVEYAAAKLNQDFLRKLIDAPFDNTRYELLQKKCDPAVWTRFYEIMAKDQQEFMRFTTDLHRLVDQVKNAMIIPPQPAAQ